MFNDEQKNIQADIDEQTRIRNERDIDDLKHVLKSKQGRRVLWRLLERCGTFWISYVPQDAGATAFNEGQRNIGNQLLSEINKCGYDHTVLKKDYEGEK